MGFQYNKGTYFVGKVQIIIFKKQKHCLEHRTCQVNKFK